MTHPLFSSSLLFQITYVFLRMNILKHRNNYHKNVKSKVSSHLFKNQLSRYCFAVIPVTRLKYR